VDNHVRIEASDAEARQQLARYMIRAPFSLDKTEYKAEMEDPEPVASVIEGIPEQLDPEVSRAARAAWARLIKKGELRPLVRWTNAAQRTPGQGVEEDREAPVALHSDARGDHGRTSLGLSAKQDSVAPQVRAGGCPLPRRRAMEGNFAPPDRYLAPIVAGKCASCP
jgi:hypothetical protein